MANGIGNAVGVRHTETSLIVWSEEAITPTQDTTPGRDETHPGEVDPVFQADEIFNAGDQGCAAGPMEKIAEILSRMTSGQTLEIYATDPSVDVDLGAWCRMTGNLLEDQQGHHYLIRKK